MKTLALVLLLVVSACAAQTRPPPPAPTEAELAALADEAALAAERWLRLIDRREYEAAWGEASVQARRHFPAAEWAAAVARMRERLGALGGRELTVARPVERPRGAPPGQYVEVVYRSSFANRPDASERLLLVRDAGEWRGFGYVVEG